MRILVCIFLLLPGLLTSLPLQAQQDLHFRPFTVAQGLNDGFINAISQDRYGFMWFASLGGLNQYNGNTMRFYHHIPGDSSSPYSSLAVSMCSDSSGRFWIGFETGLMEFDFATAKFRAIKAMHGYYIYKMVAADSNRLFLATNRGLMMYQPNKNKLSVVRPTGIAHVEKFASPVYDLEKRGDRLYVAGSAGLFAFHLSQNNIQPVNIPGMPNARIKAAKHDANGDLWIAIAGETKLLRVDSNYKVASYTNWISNNSAAVLNNINAITTDHLGNIWIITNHDGVLRYTATSRLMQKFVFRQGMPNSLSENLARSIFEDRNGTVWFGGSLGCNYTNPQTSWFSTLMPFPDSLDIRNRRIARGLDFDKHGNWWMTTGDGVVKYEPSSASYTIWNNKPGQPNQVYYNSIRGIACDDENNIWIGTGAGVNAYKSASNAMEFIPTTTMPNGFYLSVNKDRKGRIWFGTNRGDGCYWYDPSTKIFHSIREYAGLEHFTGLGVRYFLEDSRSRFWFGFNGAGLGMYDPAKNKSITWNTTQPKDSTIIGNLVIDIKEDKTGTIWASTNNGITGIDTDHNKYYSFNKENGLLSNTASALAVDPLNRLWIATTRGINMLDSSRKIFRAFGIANGLPTDQFPEHPGVIAPDGDIVFPSFNGYVKFNPLSFRNDTSLIPVYLDNVLVQARPYGIRGEVADVQKLNLKHDENAFTLSFAVPNITYHDQLWYAYKLEGFDKDWIYTQNNEISYTNVPGGNYRFLFKANTNKGAWNFAGKELAIHVDTVFYKTTWFRLLVVLLISALLYAWYRSRLHQQKEVLQLQGKAQMLEKEKVRVMYENLKQHLNPHFLFNSLTSLSSLIRLDQEMAGDFLDRMSKIYRYILKNRDSETVSLQEELEFTDHYIQLQKTRFEDALQVNVNIDEEDMDKKLAPVTIQNLVENAIKHNLLSKSKPLTIELFIEQNYLVVRNNLQRKNFVETSNKQGLQSMRSLYAFMTDQPLLIEEDSQYFMVKIPLI